MNANSIKKYVIYCVVIAAIFFIGSLVAAEKCSEEKGFLLEKVLADLNCSEQNAEVIKRVFDEEVSKCDITLIEGICKPSSGEEGLKEEDSLRLELNNTTIRDFDH